MTISFSYAYFKGLHRMMESAPVCIMQRDLCSRPSQNRNFTLHTSTKEIYPYSDYRCASLQSGNIASQNVHQHCLGNIVRIMTGCDAIHSQKCGTSVQRLSSENSAECTIILTADLKYVTHAVTRELSVTQTKTSYWRNATKCVSPLRQWSPSSIHTALCTIRPLAVCHNRLCSAPQFSNCRPCILK